jgi:hypothetical protein
MQLLHTAKPHTIGIPRIQMCSPTSYLLHANLRRRYLFPVASKHGAVWKQTHSVHPVGRKQDKERSGQS